MNLNVLVRTFGTQVSRLVPAFVQASFVLMIIFLTIFSSQKMFSQVVPPGYLVDGWDYPFANGGYSIDGVTEIVITEDITVGEIIQPELEPENNLYPDNPIVDPDRECMGIFCGADDDWFNAGDVGEYRTSSKGCHIGEDWNYIFGNAGREVKVTANGQVVAIFPVNAGGYCQWGWAIVVKHYYADGSFYHSVYKHVTTPNNVGGALCDGAEDFTVAIGDWVMRGDIIARIGTGYCIAGNNAHLHFEIRNSNLNFPFNGTRDDLHLRDNGKFAYGGVTVCIEPCNEGFGSGWNAGGMSAEATANAYTNMQLDGIIDPSDFIETHRPSVYVAPGIVWQNTIGGSLHDELEVLIETLDGGYLMGGISQSSSSGDKTENAIGGPLDTDYWIVKINSDGEIEWENTIGGNNYDELTNLKQTSDGGYVLCGMSASGSSGDKTENTIGPAGTQDIWIVKINSDGEIEWENTIGGDNYENAYAICETSDGGCIIGGVSASGISGDKTEPLFSVGWGDLWIVKLDEEGIIEWDNTIGGNRDDWVNDIQQTLDGGYIIAASSNSDTSPDKAEGVIGSPDFSDCWIIKLNPAGLIEWENVIGGTSADASAAIDLVSDGGYIVGATSLSGISGDKTESSQGSGDYWVIKLNHLGEIEWQNTIGGNDFDDLVDLNVTSDGGFVIGGTSSSFISGDKTETHLGWGDYWIVKLDKDGALEWNKTIGGDDAEMLYSVEETQDGGYILGGWSISNASYDKTENSMGIIDYWVVKLGGTGCTPSPEICNSIDDDCDGMVDEDITVSITIEAFGPTTFCQGSSIALAASPTGGTYQWNKNGVPIAGATFIAYTANATGSYTCMTTVPCATATSAPIVVTVNKNPSATITAGGATTFCPGGSVVLTANAGGGLSYQWYKGANPIAGATSISYTATVSGNFKCRVTKTATGCYKNSNTIAVSAACREGEEMETSVKIYPNPTSGLFAVDIEDATSVSITVSNMLGQIVYEQYATDDRTIDLGGLPRGSYMVTVVSRAGVHSEIIVLE